MLRIALPALVAALLCSCAASRTGSTFRVVPGPTEYRLRTPEAVEVPFAQVLAKATKSTPAFVELLPRMNLKVENAYFTPGTPRQGLAGYVGTETVRLAVDPQGKLRAGKPTAQAFQDRTIAHSAEQPPVEQLVPATVAALRYHRVYYAIVFNKRSSTQSSVLIGARSTKDLDALGAKLLASPESVCGVGSRNCAVFPEACTASVELEITVNGEHRTVLWGNTLASVAPNNAAPNPVAPNLARLTMTRLRANKPVPVEVDPTDPQALRLPLLPGDTITWDKQAAR